MGSFEAEKHTKLAQQIRQTLDGILQNIQPAESANDFFETLKVQRSNDVFTEPNPRIAYDEECRQKEEEERIKKIMLMEIEEEKRLAQLREEEWESAVDSAKAKIIVEGQKEDTYLLLQKGKEDMEEKKKRL